MIYFNNDYSEGCHEKVLEALIRTNMEQTLGYGEDEYCAAAADKIRKACDTDAAVHFLVGGTQANLTVIDAALRPHQGALCPVSGHIAVHETGAVEATGHKVLTVPSDDGKITAAQVEQTVLAHRADASFEHMVQPKLVYISNPTEWGTLYSLEELTALSETCHKLGLFLFLDGARLGYGLASQENDLTLADIARLCDVFYIGGTKVGAMLGEAVVIANPRIGEDFRYIMKQRGGMLAKGWLLGLQFEALLEDGLYFRMTQSANRFAQQLRDALKTLGYAMPVDSPTNQVFVVMPNRILEQLQKDFTYTHWETVDDEHTLVRFCTSWGTTQQDTDALCDALKSLSK